MRDTKDSQQKTAVQYFSRTDPLQKEWIDSYEGYYVVLTTSVGSYQGVIKKHTSKNYIGISKDLVSTKWVDMAEVKSIEFVW